jgi:hypothetical protein
MANQDWFENEAVVSYADPTAPGGRTLIPKRPDTLAQIDAKRTEFGVPNPNASVNPYAGTGLASPDQIRADTLAKTPFMAAPSPTAPAATTVAAGTETVSGNQDRTPIKRDEVSDGGTPTAPMMGSETVTTTGYQSKSTSPEALAGLRASGDMAKAAEGMKAAADLKENELRYNILEAQDKVVKDFQAQEATIEAEVARRANEWNERIRSADMKYASAGVDSNRLWADSSTGSKVAAGVGIMLGALGQALTGQDNAALKVIENAIDRDIDIQKANMDKAGREASYTQSAYANYLAATGDERAARLALHNSALRNIQVTMEAQAGKGIADEKVRASLLANSAKITEKIAANQAELSTIQKTKQTVTTTAPVRVSAPALGATYWNDTLGKEMSDRRDGLAMVDESLEMLNDPEIAGSMGFVDANLLKAASTASFQVPERYTKLKAAQGLLVTSILKRMSGQGVTEAEYNRWRQLLPMVEQNPANARALAEQFLKKEKREYEDRYKTATRNIANPEGQRIFMDTFKPTWTAEQEVGFKAD